MTTRLLKTGNKTTLLAIGICASVVISSLVVYFYFPPKPNPIAAEAFRLTNATLNYFWDHNADLFRAPVKSTESVDSEGDFNNGYTFWPSILMFIALADAELSFPHRFNVKLLEVFKGLEQYYDPGVHAYNGWVMFPGNNDKYYDDNGLAILGLVKAYLATKDQRYFTRANEIMDSFMKGGWDASGSPGGMRWGTFSESHPHTDRNACSTALAAISALLLAQQGVNREGNIAWATQLLEWIRSNLLDPSDNLVQDGLWWDSTTASWSLNPMKWTYNTGNTLWGYVLLS